MSENATPNEVEIQIVLTDIVSVELVDSNEDTGGRRTQEPSARWPDDGELALVKVINQAAVKLQPCQRQEIERQRGCMTLKKDWTYADVRVHHEGDAEKAIHDGIGTGRGNEGCGSERDEGCGEDTLEGPVVRAVRTVGGRERRRVVYCPLVDGYQGSKLELIDKDAKRITHGHQGHRRYRSARCALNTGGPSQRGG